MEAEALVPVVAGGSIMTMAHFSDRDVLTIVLVVAAFLHVAHAVDLIPVAEIEKPVNFC